MNQTEAAWLAGLYEGEGSLIESRRHTWALSVTMTDRDVIERAHHVSGVGTVTEVKKSTEGWQDQWRWRVMRRDDIRVVVDSIRSHLGTRRGERVDEFIAWHESMPVVPEYTLLPPAREGFCRNGHPKIEGAKACRACARDRQRRARDRRTTAV